MIAHSKPIALPNTNNSQLAYAEGFYTGDSNGAFNPASFTRHFLGSPISWRASSFTNRFPASPTAQLLSSIEYVSVIILIINLLTSLSVSGKTPMDDSLLNAVNVFEREGELVRSILLYLPIKGLIFHILSAVITPAAICNSTTYTLFSNISKKSTSWSWIPPRPNLKHIFKSLLIQPYTTKNHTSTTQMIWN